MARLPLAILTVAAALLAATAARAADPAAGKAEFQKTCSNCHDLADWKGKSEAQLEGMIKNVVAGKTKHPRKLALSDAQIADIATWASSGG
ncbi:MAG TPA: hypothetical protein VMU67_13355 [Steroidobacteraceae bacterium]|nr:hypothetical protein [Steroidobacteraceae bacterium]